MTLDPSVKTEFRTTRFNRNYRYRNYSQVIIDCPYEDSEENPYFRPKFGCILYIGNRSVDVISHVMITEQWPNELSCCILYNSQSDWYHVKVYPDIRNAINIDGDYVKGQELFDAFIRDSIQNNSKDKYKLWDAFQEQFTLLNQVFHKDLTLLLIKTQFRSWYSQLYLQYPFVVVRETPFQIKHCNDNWLLDSKLFLKCQSIDHFKNNWHCDSYGNAIDITQKEIRATHVIYIGPLFKKVIYSVLMQYSGDHIQSIDDNSHLRMCSYDILQRKYRACLIEKLNIARDAILKHLKLKAMPLKRIAIPLNTEIITDLEALIMDRLTKFIQRQKDKQSDFRIHWYRCVRNDFLRCSNDKAIDAAVATVLKDKLQRTFDYHTVKAKQFGLKIDKKAVKLLLQFRIECQSN